MKKHLLTVCLLGLTACASNGPTSYQQYFASKKVPEPTLERFPHCHGYGCQIIDSVKLSDSDWEDIEKFFLIKPKDAEQERKILENVIGFFEQKVGGLTGTAEDERGTFINVGRYQIDCVDESVNTSVYVLLLKEKGLVKFHDVEPPMIRLPIVGGGGWVHQTAVIRDIRTGDKFALDSWFHDNGQMAHAVPLGDWQTGWRPDKTKTYEKVNLPRR